MPRDFDRLDLTAAERCAILTTMLDLIDADGAIREIVVQAKCAADAAAARERTPDLVTRHSFHQSELINMYRERAVSAARVALIGLRAQLASDPRPGVEQRIADMTEILTRYAPDSHLADMASIAAGTPGSGKGDLTRPLVWALAPEAQVAAKAQPCSG